MNRRELDATRHEKVRWGDSQRLTFSVGGLAFDETQGPLQFVDARVFRPTTWSLLAQAVVVTGQAGDVVTAFLDVDVGVGSGRVAVSFPFVGLVVGGPPVTANTIGGAPPTMAVFPILLPAEALYVNARVQVVNPAPLSPHRTIVLVSALVAPVFSEVA